MFQDRARVQETLNAGFHGHPVLVAGDLILDRYIWGEVSRISPEAPVPVVRILRESSRCGGAAHVAVNLANLGLVPRICGWVGEDEEGRLLKRLLGQAGVATGGIHSLPDRPTIAKTRVIGGRQQMLRLDLEQTDPVSEAVWSNFVQHVLTELHREPRPGAVILSDYGKGTLAEPVCQAIIQQARAIGVPVLVDPKGMHYDKYRGATTLTPNRRELAEAIPMAGGDLERLLAAGELLRQRIEADFLAVTLSELGIALLEGEEPPIRIPATAREVFDVSGAGDAVIAVLAAGMTAGLPRLDALHLANLAAGVVVGKVGTSPIYREELMAALFSEEALAQADKISPNLENALSRIEAWRQKGERLVFTNGCFDLLHAGHVTYLEKARNLGNRLIVGLNTDRSVQAIKGPTRPVIRQEDRARVLAALASVDMILLFDEETPIELIRAIRPEVLAKGADYTADQVVGGGEVPSWGGRVALIPLEPGRSSSNILHHIQATKGAS
ncbi:MAG: D-glycero-beta-D-manno-heptose 1-phosphate adenylyltransferase [Magnetococcales bacterium]|nr:D-glycero-beta-D-manno-heptose 1-phosphate adenylyltransferase [Magnetococcales bacterium]